MKYKNTAHLFFYVVRRPKDFFKGVKQILHQYDNVVLKDVIIGDEFYNIVDNAEYAKVLLYNATSELKILRRAIHYRKVFSAFEQFVDYYISNNTNISKYFFYTADEGVWGEFITELRSKFEKKYSVEIVIINIQHGFFTLERPSVVFVRRIVNFIFRSFFSYSILGKGFGGSKLDNYLVYGKLEKQFLEAISPESNIIISPSICKYELIEEIYKLQCTEIIKPNAEIKKNVLFAAQLNDINPDCLYPEEEITKRIAPLFKALNQKGYKIYYRLHPAIPDKERYINLLDKYGIKNIVIFANSESLSYYLARVGTVIALQSTTLYDGYVVGRMPIIIRGLTKKFDFTTPHEIINLSKNIEVEINDAFDKIDLYYKERIDLTIEREVRTYFNKLINE